MVRFADAYCKGLDGKQAAWGHGQEEDIVDIASCLHHLLWKLTLHVTTVALAMSSRMQMHEEAFTKRNLIIYLAIT